jgi:hypothetical protein
MPCMTGRARRTCDMIVHRREEIRCVQSREAQVQCIRQAFNRMALRTADGMRSKIRRCK